MNRGERAWDRTKLVPGRAFHLPSMVIARILQKTGQKGNSMSQEQPQWQPISQLALIASHIDGMLEAAQEQYQTLQPARAKPHVLDNDTVGRVIDVFTVQKHGLWLFEEQLQRWTAQSLTPRQRTEVQRLTSQMAKLRQVIGDILALADELKKGAIEQVLGKSDEELGLDVLLRHLTGQ